MNDNKLENNKENSNNVDVQIHSGILQAFAVINDAHQQFSY